MSPLDDFNTDTAMAETGQRSHAKRRLSDKILAAFNHAYSVGEYDIADQLKSALANNENKAGPYKEMRKFYDPLGEAELWVSFVNMRNSYRLACDQKDGDANAVVEALESMKEAYRLWSQS